MIRSYEIVKADSLEYMKTMPDQSVDFILTDPPYNLSLFSTHIHEIQHIVAKIRNTLNIGLEKITVKVSPSRIYLK